MTTPNWKWLIPKWDDLPFFAGTLAGLGMADMMEGKLSVGVTSVIVGLLLDEAARIKRKGDTRP